MIIDLLRLPHEEFEYFQEMDIHDALIDNAVEFMDIIAEFYQGWSESPESVELPKKQVFSSDRYDGDFRVMPCVIDGADARIQSVKIIGTNEENMVVKDKICVGKSFLIHPADNYIYAMFDVCALSSFRTAAISVLAFSKLMKVFDKAGVAGLGRIGFYTVYILNKWLGVKEFFCFDPCSSAVDNFSKLIKHYLPDLEISYCDFNELRSSAESVFVATDSAVPLFDRKKAQNQRFISSVGADADNLSEIDSSLADEWQIFTDSEQSMLLGDLSRWEKSGLVKNENITELRAVFGGASVDCDKKLFISTGIAVQDGLIADFLYKKLSKKNVKVEI